MRCYCTLIHNQWFTRQISFHYYSIKIFTLDNHLPCEIDSLSCVSFCTESLVINKWPLCVSRSSFVWFNSSIRVEFSISLLSSWDCNTKFKCINYNNNCKCFKLECLAKPKKIFFHIYLGLSEAQQMFQLFDQDNLQ